MIKYVFRSLASFAVVFSLVSCGSLKKVTYLQDAGDGYQQAGSITYDIRIHPDDLLSIMVNSKDPELTQMFNLPLTGVVNNSIQSGQFRVLGYEVDKQGYIDFPQLGKIKAQGKSRNELGAYIKSELISKGYVNDPVVTVQFVNFKVSVMGEVARPGAFEVVTDRITIFDALSSAGDLTIYGRRDNVKIIREIDGVNTVHVVDLRDASIMDSPYYYLQQNDVIYVEPNKVKAGQREINQNRSVGTYASIFSVILSAVAVALNIW